MLFRSMRNLPAPPDHRVDLRLGQPFPASAHAVSVSLPSWQDVVRFEEEDATLLAHIKNGYPRCFIHPYIEDLAREVGGSEFCLPFPSPRVAGLAHSYVRHASGQAAEIEFRAGIFAVRTTPIGHQALRAFWQHTGLIFSSRRAQAVLSGPAPRPEDPEIRMSLRRQIAGLYDCSERDVFLAPTGMASHYMALQAVRSMTPSVPTVQLGFCNVDTLRLQERFGDGCIMLPLLDLAARDLLRVLNQRKVAGCFCEVPGNPLLGTPNLPRISPLLRQHRIPLVADDVISTAFNVDLGSHADLIATSLTKFMSGSGDVMGGALICNPRSPFYDQLKALIATEYEDLLWTADAAILERQIRQFTERMKQHNRNGLLIAERLKDHPSVERVWYPKWESQEAYEAVRRRTAGWGAVVSFIPWNADVAAPEIYNRLELCKGPSLGTVFTLACPFALLACYRELDWAESCGIPRNLIRVSIGLEDPEHIWSRLNTALFSSPTLGKLVH